ncbi:hypothetical protein V6N12_067706, partial [Hibiscus sabdariffa]
SLESKLESLKAEKRDDSRVGYDSSRTESVLPCPKSEGVEFSSKDTDKDGLSAGSFTQEAETKWPPDCPVPAAVPAEEMDSKTEKISFIDNLADAFLGGQLRCIKKKRGKRKRKYCSKDSKEGSVGESEFLGPSDFTSVSWYKETSASNSAQVGRSSGVEDLSRDSSKEGLDEIMEIFSSVAENDCASVFRRRLDSQMISTLFFPHIQKRGRYKKMILRHMDFNTIRSRIGNSSIMSVRELFRDMLLVANNALVFYSKNTREHKSALLLRHIVTATFRQHFKEYGSKAPITPLTSTRPMHKPPAKPRSIRPGNRKQPGNATNNRNTVIGSTHVNKKSTNASSPPSVESLAVTKKGSARPKKGGCGRASQKSETPAKGRKRTRAR